MKNPFDEKIPLPKIGGRSKSIAPKKLLLPVWSTLENKTVYQGRKAHSKYATPKRPERKEFIKIEDSPTRSSRNINDDLRAKVLKDYGFDSSSDAYRRTISGHFTNLHIS